MKFGRTAIPTLNSHILETKRAILDRWCQNSRMIEGFHLLFHESGLAPLFHPLSASFSQKKTLFRGVPGCSQLLSSIRICPRDRFPSRKKNLLYLLKEKRCDRLCDLFVEVFSLSLPENKFYIVKGVKTERDQHIY